MIIWLMKKWWCLLLNLGGFRVLAARDLEEAVPLALLVLELLWRLLFLQLRLIFWGTLKDLTLLIISQNITMLLRGTLQSRWWLTFYRINVLLILYFWYLAASLSPFFFILSALKDLGEKDSSRLEDSWEWFARLFSVYTLCRSMLATLFTFFFLVANRNNICESLWIKNGSFESCNCWSWGDSLPWGSFLFRYSLPWHLSFSATSNVLNNYFLNVFFFFFTSDDLWFCW